MGPVCHGSPRVIPDPCPLSQADDTDPGTFTVEPASGVLGAGATTTVRLRYAPMDVDGPHRCVLQGTVHNLLPDAPQPRIELSGTAECPLVHFEMTPSDYLSADRRPPEFQGPGSSLGVIDPSTTQVSAPLPHWPTAQPPMDSCTHRPTDPDTG